MSYEFDVCVNCNDVFSIREGCDCAFAEKGHAVEVAEQPTCDFCMDKASYDGRMATVSAWGYFCEAHWQVHGCGKTGIGFGQRLVVAA